MKTKYVLVLLMLSVVVLTACTTSPTPANNEQAVNSQPSASDQKTEPAKTAVPETKTADAGQSVTMDKIYNYGKLKNFEYKITTTAAGTTTSTDMKYALSSDTINGKAAWLSTAEITMEGTRVLAKTWTDKTTFACLKTSSVITFNGQDMETAGECPKTGPGSESSGTMPTLTYQGIESVTVPAGTYSAKKYLLDNKITYYYTDTVPIPVKVVYSGEGSSIMELVSWN